MTSRRLIATLVVAYATCIVAFGVLMGGYAIAASTGDAFGARLLWTTAMAVAVLLAITAIVLIGALGLIQWLNSQPPPPRKKPRRRGPAPTRHRS